MTLQLGDLLAITRPVGPQAGTYQLPAAALAELLNPPPVLGITGVLWATVRSAADNSWQAIRCSPELGLDACVAGSDTGNRVMTSSDGIRLSPQQSAADQNWVALCWAAELGLFLAVSDSGIGNRVMTLASDAAGTCARRRPTTIGPRSAGHPSWAYLWLLPAVVSATG